jgi:hypothetical protein
MPSYPTRAEQLRALAGRLGAEQVPYYLHSPRGAGEPAPGWYWRPAGAQHPAYLAANHMDAYVKLHGLVAAAIGRDAA